MSRLWIKLLFYVAALYDGVLGLIFVLFWPAIFRAFDVTPPNHAGYVQFPALVLIIFAVSFMRIAVNPEENRNLVPYGIALKAAYSGTVFWHEVTSGIPPMWVWFAWSDLAFLVFFVIAFRSLGTRFVRAQHA